MPTKDQLPQLKSTGFWMEAREGEIFGSEEWKHLGRVCNEVAPEEEGEGGGEPEEEVKKEEVRLTAREEPETKEDHGHRCVCTGRSEGHFLVACVWPQVA